MSFTTFTLLVALVVGAAMSATAYHVAVLAGGPVFVSLQPGSSRRPRWQHLPLVGCGGPGPLQPGPPASDFIHIRHWQW
jgi:hypothetical protein